MINWQIKTFDELTNTELYAILSLRQEVFIVEQNCAYLDNDGKDVYALHLTGFVDENMVAYCRLIPAGISYEEVSIGRVITSPASRMEGYGKQLMQKAIEQINGIYGNVPIRIGAQAYLKKFYEGFGFKDLDEPYMEDGIPHLIMLRPA